MPGGFITTPKQSQSARKSHNAFWDIGHVLSGTGKGLYHGITGLPTAAYMGGRAVLGDTSHLLTGGDFTHPHYHYKSPELAKNIAKAEYESWRHFGKGGDISGPLLDTMALLTGGSSLAARGGKALSTISKTAKTERSTRAAELATKDAAVAMAKGGSGVKGIGFDKAAGMFKVPAGELKKHARIHKHGLEEGNMSVGKPKGVQGKYANDPPHEVLKNGKHPLFDFYAERYPQHLSNTTRARSAFMQRPQYSRPIYKGKPLNKTRSGFYVPTSPNPLFRGIRAGVEQVRPASSAARELKKEAVRREITQERFNAPKNLRVSARNNAPSYQGVAAKALGVPMGALRMAMWLRPRYYLQNLAQTGQMLGTNPILSARSMKLASELFKHDRPLYNTVRAVTGEAQAGALAAGTSPSKLGAAVGKRIGGRVGKQIEQRGIQGAMGYAANIPESHARMISVLNELQKHNRKTSMGALTPAKVEQAFGNVRRGGVISKEHLPLRRAVEEVGDFGRIFSKNMLKQRTPSEREFMATQLPIFYPMFKALTRYGVRFPSEHSVLSASGLAAGKQGKKEQKRLLGSLPFWAQYLIPKSAGDPNAVRSPHQAVFNPANIFNLQPTADIARQAAEMTRRGGPVPGLSLLQEFGPAPGIAYGAFTGKDIQTGYPIKPFSKGFYKAHPNFNNSLFNTSANFLQGLPLADIQRLAAGQSPHVRSFAKGSAKDRLLQELLGPSIISRTLKTKETTKQARRERHYGQGRTKKKSPYDG